MEPNRAPKTGEDGNLDSALLNDWHVVAAATDIVPGNLVPLTLFERDLDAWRDTRGDVHIWEDLCVVPFPEWDDDSYKRVVCGPYRFRSGYRAVENFFDPTHFPFVHAGVNRVFEAPDPIPPYEVA